MRSRVRFRVALAWALLLVAVPWCMAGWAGYTAVRWSLARYWPAVPCGILGSWVEELSDDYPYRFRVVYHYRWAGRDYDGWTYTEDYRGSQDIAKADRLVRAFPIGSHRVCYVNPGNPSESILGHDDVWIPAVLAVTIFLCGAFLAKTLVLTCPRPGALNAPLTVFVAVMMLGSYTYGFGLPLWKGLRSLGWRATPCAIQSGQVRSVVHYSLMLSFRSYWPDVVYHYEVNGVAYRANTYNASEVGSPWYYGAKGDVRLHPPGMRTTCYVNPSDPSEAVMVRTLSGTQWFGVGPLGLALLLFWAVVESMSGRAIKVGTPRCWITLALGAVTTSAWTILWITGADLLRDSNEGVAEWQEFVVVAVAGLISAGLMHGWVLLAVNHRGERRREGIATTPSVVWDREIDQLPNAKGRPK